MQTVAVSWEIYDRTIKIEILALAMVGLVQIIPVIGLFLPAGHLIDRLDRRKILSGGSLADNCILLGRPPLIAHETGGSVGWMYLFLLLIGVARTFMQPARAAFLPQIVPRAVFSNAVTWNSTGFQLSSVVGPALAGPPDRLTQPMTQMIYALAAMMAASSISAAWR